MEIYNLISKFFAREISENEIIVLKSMLEQDPESRRIFNEQNELWQETSLSDKIENYKSDTGWIKVSARLGLGKKSKSSLILMKKNNFRLLIAAATVAVMIAIGGLSFVVNARKPFLKAVTNATIISTNEGERSHVLLADSTEVYLNSGSKLEYNSLYNLDERNVKLSGEAFFNVHTNPEKPFIVETGNMKIIATGTRFNILSYVNEDRVETTLEEGKVQALVQGRESINIVPGQQIVYLKKSGKLEIREVPVDTYTSWKENKLRFFNTQFEEALRKIARKYNVTFEITNNDLLNLKYTATFIDESIEDVMSMLSAISPITYKIHNRTTINDKKYLKPRIVVGKRKS